MPSTFSSSTDSYHIAALVVLRVAAPLSTWYLTHRRVTRYGAEIELRFRPQEGCSITESQRLATGFNLALPPKTAISEFNKEYKCTIFGLDGTLQTTVSPTLINLAVFTPARR